MKRHRSSILIESSIEDWPGPAHAETQTIQPGHLVESHVLVIRLLLVGHQPPVAFRRNATCSRGAISAPYGEPPSLSAALTVMGV
jgi:hypothetical protein